jgi:L-arabinokinase
MVSLTCSNLPFCLIRLESGYEAVLPTSLSGERFLEMFSSHNDPFTKIKPDRVYDVKVPAAHPIYENFRVKVLDSKTE